MSAYEGDPEKLFARMQELRKELLDRENDLAHVLAWVGRGWNATRLAEHNKICKDGNKCILADNPYAKGEMKQ